MSRPAGEFDTDSNIDRANKDLEYKNSQVFLWR